MRSATRDLLRLSSTVAVITGCFLWASFAGSPAAPARGAAKARTDSIVRVGAISHDRIAAPPFVALPNAIEFEAPSGVVIAKTRSAHRRLLALAP